MVAAELAEAKETAKAELDEYVDAAEYEVNAEALATAIAEGKEAVDAAATTEDVDAAVVAAKEAIDAIETDEEIAVREAEEALVEATEAVVVAEESLLEADLADARELVDALEDSDEKVLLGARLDSLQLKLNGIRDAVNNATTEIQLDRALNVKPFVDYDVANITDYLIARGANVFTTIADIQEDVIDAVNATAEAGELGTLVTTATNAVIAAEADPDGDVAAPGTGTLIAAAQEAIDALPAEITEAQATAAGTVVTIKADLQERLEDVKIVAPVVAATNQIELLPALENNFDRVNEDLIATYETNLLATDITVAAIQGKIDVANLSAAQTAVGDAETAPLTAEKVATAQALVNYLAEDVAPATTKADLQEDLDVVTALIAVADATTEAELLAALENEVLALTDVNPEAIAEYKEEIDTNSADITTAANVQANVVDAGNTAAETAAVTAITTNFVTYDETLAADQAKALKELNRLADVSDLDKETIDAELIEQYIVAIEADLTGGTSTIDGTDDAAAIQALIDAENDIKDETLRLAVVNEATTATEMRTALTAVAVAEGTTAYINLSSQAKLEVAELVLVARNAITGTPATAKKFALTTDVTTAIGTANTARTNFLTAVNAATDIDGMITALDKVEFPEFQDLGTLEQVDAAELVLSVLEALQAETPAAEFKTIAEVKTAAGL